MAYETVHTVSDFFDGPREGLADFRGKPHRYKCDWDKATDDWAETFTLTPVDAETFQLELERWKIWREWEQAFHAGLVKANSHPGHGKKNARYDELAKLIDSRLSLTAPLEIQATAHFRVAAVQSPGGVMRELEVEWTLPPDIPV